ncbi:MAG: NAD-dependent epimerase/dehydratase family protein, partial [Candidatus Levyibacteriota bacterium]
IAIFHLATYADYRDQNKIFEMIEANIKITANLLLSTVGINYKVFVNTGSSSEYGFKKKAMRERDLLEPISFYAATKAGTTLLAQAFAYYYKKPVVTLRPFSVYGPLEEEKRFIPTIIKSIINGKSINLTTGSQKRDFVFIDDIVEAFIKTIDNGTRLTGQIVNIGTGKQYSNDEVVNKLFKVTGKKVKINKGKFPLRIWDSPYWVADISKAKKLLGWTPAHSLENGLLKTYNWFTQAQ